jgi:hypothetical protein
VIVGSSTEYFRASPGIMEFLNSFPEKPFRKRVAAFDTQLQSRISGNEAEGTEKKLKKLGFEIFTAQLVTYVEGRMDEM